MHNKSAHHDYQASRGAPLDPSDDEPLLHHAERINPADVSRILESMAQESEVQAELVDWLMGRSGVARS